MNINDLRKNKCTPCKSSEDVLDAKLVVCLASELGWGINSSGHIFKEFQFTNFRQALEFANKVGVLADIENHHPDILVQWGKATVTLYTHSINGLSLNDFILASKIAI